MFTQSIVFSLDTKDIKYIYFVFAISRNIQLALFVIYFPKCKGL